MSETGAFVHETAIVEDDVVIGAGTKIWHHVHVSRGAQVGARSILGKNVFVGRGVTVGEGVKVQNNVSLYTGVTLENDVFVGPSATFTNVANPRAHIERKEEFKKTPVGRGATIGANATVLCGNAIGEFAFVGAGAVVTRDVAPYALVVGNPARQIGWVDQNGDRTDAPPEEHAPESGPIPAFDPLPDLAVYGSHYGRAARRVLSSGNYILGPEVVTFEEELAEFVGAAHCIGVSSGSDALLAVLMALEIGPGDEVITTAFSFFATVGAIVRLGATPVLVDIDPQSFNLDVDQAIDAITAKTKALITVHLFGQTLDQTRLKAECAQAGISLIEDAAQSFAAQGAEGLAGTEGKAGCYSFFPTKNLGGFGDGGAVVTDDAKLAERLRAVRVHGATSKNHHEVLGGNFRLDPLHAALLLEKLPRIEGELAQRRRAAQRYDELFVDAGLVNEERLSIPARVGVDHSFNQYVIRAKRRDALKASLADAQIATAVYYPRALSEQPVMRERARLMGEIAHTKQACEEVLALPFSPSITRQEQERIVAAMAQFYQ